MSTRPRPSPPAWSHTRMSPKAPAPWLLMLEGRAPWEFAATIASWPLLRTLPRGDGHPVLVLPGLAAGDLSTLVLRLFLGQLGYAAHPWNYGMNFGPRPGVLRGCIEHARELSQLHGRSVSLVGWSLGGIYAREMAKAAPDVIRCVITLGTPFSGHPKSTHAWRLFELMSGVTADDPDLHAPLADPPPVPTTSILSKTDGIVAWQCSVNREAPRVENIVVPASHLGLGMNPATLYAVADRLAQPVDDWQPFAVEGARRWFFARPEADATERGAGPDVPNATTAAARRSKAERR